MNHPVRWSLVLGLTLSSMTTACVLEQAPTQRDAEEVGEARGAFETTLLECYENYQDYTISCHELPDRSDFEICLFFAKEAYKNCCNEAGADCDDGAPVELPTQTRRIPGGGGFLDGFGGGDDPFVIP